MSVYPALIGRIRQSLLDMEQVVSRCESLLEKARRTAADGYLDGVALMDNPIIVRCREDA